MNLADTILTELTSNPGQTMAKITEMLNSKYSTRENSVRSILSRMNSLDYLRVSYGSCCECGSSRKLYWATEKGINLLKTGGKVSL